MASMMMQGMRIGLSQSQARSSRFKTPFMMSGSGSLITDSFRSIESNSQNSSEKLSESSDVSSTVILMTESISICDSSDTFLLESEEVHENDVEALVMSPVIVSRRRSPGSAETSISVGLDNTGRTTATTVQTSLPVRLPMTRQSAIAQNRSKRTTSLRKINPAPRIKKAAGCITLSKWKARLELLDLIAKMGREIKQIKAKAALRKQAENNRGPTEPPQASMKRKLTLNEKLFDGEALEEDENGGTVAERGSDRPKLVVKARAKRPRTSVGIALNECRFMEE